MRKLGRLYLYIMAVLLSVAFMACDSKKETDPLSAIQNLAEEIGKKGDGWEETQWNEAADQLSAEW